MVEDSQLHSNMVETVKNGQKRVKMVFKKLSKTVKIVQNGQYGQKRSIHSKTVKNGQTWSKTIKIINTVKNGQYGQKRLKQSTILNPSVGQPLLGPANK